MATPAGPATKRSKGEGGSLGDRASSLYDVQLLAREEEAKLEESLAALRTRKTQMQEALAAFDIARGDAAMGGDGGFTQACAADRKIEKAEAVFDRAMTGAGGVGFSRGDAAAINSVAESWRATCRNAHR